MEKKPDTIGIRYRLFYSLFNTQLFCNTKNMQKSNIERILSVYNFHKKKERRKESEKRKETSRFKRAILKEENTYRTAHPYTTLPRANVIGCRC